MHGTRRGGTRTTTRLVLFPPIPPRRPRPARLTYELQERCLRVVASSGMMPSRFSRGRKLRCDDANVQWAKLAAHCLLQHLATADLRGDAMPRPRGFRNHFGQSYSGPERRYCASSVHAQATLDRPAPCCCPAESRAVFCFLFSVFC